MTDDAGPAIFSEEELKLYRALSMDIEKALMGHSVILILIALVERYVSVVVDEEVNDPELSALSILFVENVLSVLNNPERKQQLREKSNVTNTAMPKHLDS